MPGAFPEAARDGVVPRLMAQTRADADVPLADSDGAAASSAFERCIERLEAVVEQETAALKGRAAANLGDTDHDVDFAAWLLENRAAIAAGGLPAFGAESNRLEVS